MKMKAVRPIALETGIGIEEGARKEIAEALSSLLADSYLLFLKTHNYHWNVTGPQFVSLHQFFEQQYQELFEAVDTIAERIRALGHPAPATFTEFARRASIRETPGVPEASAMVEELAEGHEAIARLCRKHFPTVERASDEATADLLTARIQTHEKQAWMLRSLVR